MEVTLKELRNKLTELIDEAKSIDSTIHIKKYNDKIGIVLPEGTTSYELVVVFEKILDHKFYKGLLDIPDLKKIKIDNTNHITVIYISIMFLNFLFDFLRNLNDYPVKGHPLNAENIFRNIGAIKYDIIQEFKRRTKTNKTFEELDNTFGINEIFDDVKAKIDKGIPAEPEDFLYSFVKEFFK